MKINEIRIDQPSTDNDEYFELIGTPNASLDGLTYVVIGDGSGGSGVIEAAIDLTGQSFDSNGLFVVAEDTFTLGTANLTADLNFENSDNVTHLLVQGFTGAVGDDLDTDDDGALDTEPWASVVDSVALVEDLEDGEQVYSTTQVGPDGSFVPAHVFRDGTSENFVIGEFDPADGSDTPGAVNPSEENGGGDGGGNGDGGSGTLTPIYDIQGAAHVSPLVGNAVTTQGIVTAVDSNGFYVQDAVGDGDIATSDALFVFTGDAPEVSVGDEVEIAGTVSEFTPGGTSTGNLSTTQISGSPTVSVLSSGNALPDAVILGNSGRVVPNQNIDDDAFGAFEPTTDGIDFFESVEAMRVTVEDALAIAPTNRFGEIFTVANQGADASGISDRGTLNISSDDFNPEKIQIDADSGVLPDFDIPEVDAGATLGDVTGVVSYGFGNFEVIPTEPFSVTAASPLTPETTTLSNGDDELTIASYNVLNLDVNDADGDTDVADGRFEAIASQIVDDLNSPDIIALQEVQDNSGSVDDGTTAADETLQALVDAIAAAGGPTYEFIDNTFITDNASGGQPGGNIRTAYLYDPDSVSLIGEPEPVGSQAEGAAFDGARLPLAATFDFNGEEVTVVNNHFSSKGGSAPILGQEQDFAARQEDISVNGSLDERRVQAQAVNDYVDGVLAAEPDANVVVLGDLNEFEFVSPLQILEGTTVSAEGGQSITESGEDAVLTNLINDIPADERYSFIFQGNSQQLDHILVSDALTDSAEVDIVHVNVEFAETSERASDHDPVVASFTFEADSGSEGIFLVRDPDVSDPLFGTDADEFIAGRQGDNALFGGGGDDTVLGDLEDLGPAIGNDLLFGGSGEDLIIGGGGNDTMGGESGNDTLLGDEGSDVLIGGAGEDILVGGSDSDVFILTAEEGTNIIVDFESEDFIGLGSGLSRNQLYRVQAGENTVIGTFEGDVLAVALNTTASQFTDDVFLSI